jgi:hypothetical protein
VTPTSGPRTAASRRPRLEYHSRMRRIALLALAGGLLACQDYRFNPVGRCTIQPGQVRVNVNDVTTADVLFVVDDSFSMDQYQARLATSFSNFITGIAAIQAQRKLASKDPFDFYIAVTSSSVLVNDLVGSTCTGGSCSISGPQFPPPYSYACSPANSSCADIITSFYYVASCPTGHPEWLQRPYGQPFFAGDFVSAPSNPKVLAFTKNLDWANYTTDSTIQGLLNQFRQNVVVGPCGANQEMHLEGGRLAVQKALAGAAPNTGWLHPGAKLVVVWVGNEDDCSTPRADRGGLVWNSGSPGADTCHTEAQKTGASKLYAISDYAAFFASLGRPLGAAFIRPGDDIGPGGCVNGTSGGYGPATRFRAMADAFRALGGSVVEGSICDSDFGATLTAIADLVKPVSGLQLPSVPAADKVIQLRLLDGSGRTVHTCAGPDVAAEWWFRDCASPTGAATGGTPQGSAPSACIKLKAGGACEPQSGQSLTAVYLGQVPANGCASPSPTAPSADCAAALGGADTDWICQPVVGSTRGTCLCNGGT